MVSRSRTAQLEEQQKLHEAELAQRLTQQQKLHEAELAQRLTQQQKLHEVEVKKQEQLYEETRAQSQESPGFSHFSPSRRTRRIMEEYRQTERP